MLAFVERAPRDFNYVQIANEEAFTRQPFPGADDLAIQLGSALDGPVRAVFHQRGIDILTPEEWTQRNDR